MREFVRCYGPQSGDLQQALVFLGFSWNEKALNDLSLPARICVGREDVVVLTTRSFRLIQVRHWWGVTETSLDSDDWHKATVTQRLPVYAPMPYLDGRRESLDPNPRPSRRAIMDDFMDDMDVRFNP